MTDCEIRLAVEMESLDRIRAATEVIALLTEGFDFGGCFFVGNFSVADLHIP